MAISTVYDVRLRYMLQDKASKGLKNLTQELSRGSKASGGFGKSLRRVALIATGVFGFNKAKEALIGYNDFMQQAELRTAGLLSLTKKTDFADQLGNASDIMKELQDRAKVSTATTKEFVSFMSDIVQPISQAGLATKDIAKFTAQAVVAAKAFGDEQIAAFDIQQALGKGVTIRDRFAIKLLGLQKETAREAFNELTSAERLLKIQQALGAPQIQQLAQAQAKSFAGVFSTLKDNIQIVLGKVGLPLFKALTKEVQRMVNFFGDNEERIAQVAKSIGGGIVTAFSFAKELFVGMVNLARDMAKIIGPVIGGIRDVMVALGANKNTLIFLAKAFIAFKAFKGLIGFGKAIKDSFGKVASRADKAAAGLALLAVAASAVASAIDESQEATLKARNQLSFFRDQLATFFDEKAANDLGFGRKAAKTPQNEAQARKLTLIAEEAKRSGFLTTQGNINLQRITLELTGIRTSNDREAGIALSLKDKQAEAVQIIRRLTAVQEFMRSQQFRDAAKQLEATQNSKIAIEDAAIAIGGTILTGAQASVNGLLGAFGFGPIQIPGAKDIGRGRKEDKKNKKGPSVNVTINNIEVQSDDPDRLVFGMISAFQDAASNPNSALDSFKFREGV